MKRCHYCGKEYADKVTVCAVDGQLLANPEEKQTPPAERHGANQASFNLRLTSPISFSGAYRIYVVRNDLIFIQIEGGAKSILATLAPLLGPLGGLFPFVLWLLSKKKSKSRLQHIEEGDPEDLLPESEKNFKLHLAEIRHAAIEPATFIAASGKAGRLILTVRHGEKFKCEFGEAAEMAAAIHLLDPLLSSTLKVNVAWNGKKGRFEKKKAI